MQKAETNIRKEKEKYKHIQELMDEPNILMKLEVIRNVSAITELLIRSVFDDEISEKAGKRYQHNKSGKGIYRWGSNPGSVRIGQERVKLKVPRIRDGESSQEIPLDSYNELKAAEPDSEKLLKGILHGLSMNDYQGVVSQFEDSYGLSRSSVSERFKEESARRVEEFSTRDLSTYNFAAIFIDGKYLSKEQIIIVLGITAEGNKIPLGFVQAAAETSSTIKPLLSDIINRGFNYEEGLLCVIDGSPGIHKAIKETFGDYAVIKRCAWHKRENVISHLSEKRKEEYKKKFDRAYAMTDFTAAQNAFIDLSSELRKINISASNSVLEGLDELLALHRLGLIEDFGKSFSTTNVIESLNSQIAKYLRNVKYWKNSLQRFRWVASALMEIETRLRKVNNYQNLSILQDIIKNEVLTLTNNKNDFGAS